MENDLGQWQWVDEDPFEKLLHGPKDSGVAGSPAEPQVENFEPVHFEEAPSIIEEAPSIIEEAPSIIEEAPSISSMTAVSESNHTEAPASPVVCPENLEQSLPTPVEMIAVSEPAQADSIDSVPTVVDLHGPATDHFDLALNLEKLEQWEEAANAFRLALELDPGHAEALIGLGACLLHLDAAEEALECFKQCLLSDVGRKRALLGKAVALQKLTRYDDADRTYRELLQTSPDSPEPLANLIALSVARRDNAAVAEYSRRLLRVDPNAKAALQGLATLAIWDGNQAAAVDYCARLVEIDPVSFEGWHNLAFAKQKMHPPEQAMRSIA
jgi:tetratricopeptide (TPR) repeat protein